MWRFVDGATQPEHKKRKLDDHKRQWNIRWLVDDNGEPRKWLHYDKVK